MIVRSRVQAPLLLQIKPQFNWGSSVRGLASRNRHAEFVPAMCRSLGDQLPALVMSAIFPSVEPEWASLARAV